MTPHFEIGRLQVRIIGPGGQAEGARARLTQVASRLLPAALDAALHDLDDGVTLVILRRVESHLPLPYGESDESCAARWAQLIGESVRQLVAQLAQGRRDGRSVENEAGIAFADALALLCELVHDALGARLDRWCWQPEAGALAAAQRALAELPGGDGSSHAYASALPPPGAGSPPRMVSWALVTAGAALPRLLHALHSDGVAANALALLPAADAQRLLAGLGDEPLALAADRAALSHASSPLFPLAARIDRWPAPAPGDPRNVLLLLALAVAAQPSLRGAPGTSVAALRALVERARLIAPEPRPRLPEPSRAGAGAATDPAHAAAAADSGADAADSTAADSAAANSAARSVDAAESPSITGAESATAESGAPPITMRPRAVERAPTGFGGLLFFIPLVADLQIIDAITDEPELAADSGWSAVIYRLACLLAPQAWADSSALWLAGLDEPAGHAGALTPERAAALLRAGQRVARAAGDLPLDDHPDDELLLRKNALALPSSLAVAPWLDELCRHFAARLIAHLRGRLTLDLDAGALLSRVVEKRGMLVRTATHLRLELPLDAADVDLRRALLDLDPGWVPFLARVVSFHYV